MESRSLEDALTYWRSDMGYVQINDLLSRRIHTVSRYRKSIYVDDSHNAAVHVKTIINAMKPGSGREPEILFRGGTVVSSVMNHKREGLVSLTEDYEQALAFMDGECCVYEVQLHPDVLRIKTGIERETLIEPYCYWVNLGRGKESHVKNVMILPPEAAPKDAIWYGQIDALAREVKAEVKREQKMQSKQHAEDAQTTRATKLYDELLEELGDMLDLDLFLVSAEPYKIPDRVLRAVWEKKHD